MKSIEHNLPVSIEQVLAWLRQCTAKEKEALLSELVNSSRATMMASEKSLAKDWDSEEENEAWKDL